MVGGASPLLLLPFAVWCVTPASSRGWRVPGFRRNQDSSALQVFLHVCASEAHGSSYVSHLVSESVSWAARDGLRNPLCSRSGSTTVRARMRMGWSVRLDMGEIANRSGKGRGPPVRRQALDKGEGRGCNLVAPVASSSSKPENERVHLAHQPSPAQPLAANSEKMGSRGEGPNL